MVSSITLSFIYPAVFGSIVSVFGLNNSFNSVSVNNDLSNKLIPSSFTIYTSFNL